MPTSIFTDDTGRRSTRARWVVRVVSATLVLGVTAIVLSLFTHVSLPSLGRPNPASSEIDTSVQKPKQSRSPSADATTPTPTSTTATTSRGSSSKTADQSDTPTPTPTAVESTDTPRAAPTHVPGTPPTTPPGKSK
jgi:cytoskeletal protein RodZ